MDQVLTRTPSEKNHSILTVVLYFLRVHFYLILAILTPDMDYKISWKYELNRPLVAANGNLIKQLIYIFLINTLPNSFISSVLEIFASMYPK